MFSNEERAYIRTQRLARISTVSDESQPDVAPVGFDFDGTHFFIGGRRNESTRKYKNVRDGNTRVALAIDDLASVNPWTPRGVRIHGTAEIVQHKGYAGEGNYLRITPDKVWSWGLEQLANSTS